MSTLIFGCSIRCANGDKILLKLKGTKYFWSYFALSPKTSSRSSMVPFSDQTIRRHWSAETKRRERSGSLKSSEWRWDQFLALPRSRVGNMCFKWTGRWWWCWPNVRVHTAMWPVSVLWSSMSSTMCRYLAGISSRYLLTFFSKNFEVFLSRFLSCEGPAWICCALSRCSCASLECCYFT